MSSLCETHRKAISAKKEHRFSLFFGLVETKPMRKWTKLNAGNMIIFHTSRHNLNGLLFGFLYPRPSSCLSLFLRCRFAAHRCEFTSLICYEIEMKMLHTRLFPDFKCPLTISCINSPVPASLTAHNNSRFTIEPHVIFSTLAKPQKRCPGKKNYLSLVIFWPRNGFCVCSMYVQSGTKHIFSRPPPHFLRTNESAWNTNSATSDDATARKQHDDNDVFPSTHAVSSSRFLHPLISAIWSIIFFRGFFMDFLCA